jgi:hypothetical protein
LLLPQMRSSSSVLMWRAVSVKGGWHANHPREFRLGSWSCEIMGCLASHVNGASGIPPTPVVVE